MAIVTETAEVGGGTFTHNYSNGNFIIRKVGTDELYSEAYDIPTAGYTYEETETVMEISADRIES